MGGRTTITPRRAAQACSTCRNRKTRCDGGHPKCSLCTDLGTDCKYLDSPVVKIDPSTRLLLDRIQRLEDRLFQHDWTPRAVFSPVSTTAEPAASSRSEPQRASDSLLTLPSIHHATANHVYQWPIVRELLANNFNRDSHNDGLRYPAESATDIFILNASSSLQAGNDMGHTGTRTWRLFSEKIPDHTEIYLKFVDMFFLNVHCFFPLLRQENVHAILQSIVQQETEPAHGSPHTSLSQYCILLMVLCLGSLSCEKRHPRDRMEAEPNFPPLQDQHIDHSQHTAALWQKAQLLSGALMLETSEESAQCFVLMR